MIFHLYRHQNPLVILDAHGTKIRCVIFCSTCRLRKIDRVSYGLLGKKQLEAICGFIKKTSTPKKTNILLMEEIRITS